MSFFSTMSDVSSLQLMTYHPIKEVWFYLLAATVLTALAGYCWRDRRAPAALCWVFSLSLRSIFLLALVMVSVSPALADKVFWAKVQQISASATIPTFFLLVVSVAGQKGRIVRAVALALFAITAFAILSLLTTGWHGWFWRGVVWDGTTFGVVRGPVYWCFVAAAYLQFLILSMLCIVWARRASGLRRWQIAALPVDPLISLAGHVLWAIDQQAGVIPPLPLAFMLSGMAWSWIFFRLRVLNLMSLAESTVIGNIDDSLIITDDRGYILELNPSAQRRFSCIAPALTGRHFAEAFARWPAMAALLDINEVTEGEIHLEGSGDFSYHVTPLVSWGKLSIGKAIVFHDVTRLREAQAQIVEQQKALSIMKERERLGRELHDGAGQVWGYLSLNLQTVRSLLKGGQLDKADEQVGKVIRTIKEMNTDARESIFGLKLAAAGGDDFVINLQDYLEWYADTNGIDAELTLPDGSMAGLLPHTGEVQLLRIIQEALTNIRKHAKASKATIRIAVADRRVIAVVEDDGCGFDPAAPAKRKSFGLQIMDERAGEAGGRLRIESAPGEGTKVTVEFSLDKVAGDENAVG
ncbi:histidine kinase N-terminal 7TM domain-containing protein [Anaeroselena agilis]|uniref:histidine kinase n=1 Tax=Anaeroselena agilis TaxID=3063788 RepID=A0ABU3NS40_9FIRM|nr:histidine kinase N-terminal 7TM domain-containing protein [Selenomonadales bacterium 4137-cl]